MTAYQSSQLNKFSKGRLSKVLSATGKIFTVHNISTQKKKKTTQKVWTIPLTIFKLKVPEWVMDALHASCIQLFFLMQASSFVVTSLCRNDNYAPVEVSFNKKTVSEPSFTSTHKSWLSLRIFKCHKVLHSLTHIHVQVNLNFTTRFSRIQLKIIILSYSSIKEHTVHSQCSELRHHMHVEVMTLLKNKQAHVFLTILSFPLWRTASVNNALNPECINTKGSKWNCSWVECLNIQKQKHKVFPDYSFPVLPLTVQRGACKWKKMTRAQIVCQSDGFVFSFMALQTMLGAGGRDLDD